MGIDEDYFAVARSGVDYTVLLSNDAWSVVVAQTHVDGGYFLEFGSSGIYNHKFAVHCFCVYALSVGAVAEAFAVAVVVVTPELDLNAVLSEKITFL